MNIFGGSGQTPLYKLNLTEDYETLPLLFKENIYNIESFDNNCLKYVDL